MDRLKWRLSGDLEGAKELFEKALALDERGLEISSRDLCSFACCLEDLRLFERAKQMYALGCLKAQGLRLLSTG